MAGSVLASELPRQDLNLNKESQNPKAPQFNSIPDQAIDETALAGRSAGRSDVTDEGGISDRELAALVAAWPTLPEPIRRAMLALIRAAAP